MRYRVEITLGNTLLAMILKPTNFVQNSVKQPRKVRPYGLGNDLCIVDDKAMSEIEIVVK